MRFQETFWGPFLDPNSFKKGSQQRDQIGPWKMRKYGWQGSKREPKRVPKWSPKVRKIRAENDTKNSTTNREEQCGFEEVKTMRSVKL